MRHRSQWSENQRRCLSRLISKLHQGPLLKARTYVLRNTCGKPNCRCARGQKHQTLYVARSRKGKRQTRSVPKPFQDRLLQWIGRYQQVEDLLEQLSDESWRELDNDSGKTKAR